MRPVSHFLLTALALVLLATLPTVAGAMDGQTAQLKKDMAYALDKAGRHDEAAAVYQELLAAGQGDSQTRTRYAWLLNSLKRYDDAWEVLEPLPRPAADISTLEVQARTAYWAQEYALAEPLYRELLQRKGDDEQLRREQVQVEQHLRRPSAPSAKATAKEQVLAAGPKDPRYYPSVGRAHEAQGDKKGAIAYYLRAVQHQATPDPDLSLRLARLYRWTGQPAEAATWYRRHLDAKRTTPEAVRLEYAEGLLDAKRPRESLEVVQALGSVELADARIALTGARAASDGGQPALAAAYLERLGQLRALSVDEQLWKAGMYRAAGDKAKALAGYEAIVAARTPAPATAVEAVGDLRFDLGDYPGAVHSYLDLGRGQPLAQGGYAPPVLLKIARAADKGGDADMAAAAYEAYVQRNPKDGDVLVESARFLTRVGKLDAAQERYAAAAAAGVAVLRLEQAKLALLRKDLPTAEQLSREALADPAENPSGAVDVHAETLQAQGKILEADAFLRQWLDNHPDDALAHGRLGYVTLEQNRLLESYRQFDQAVAGGAQPKGDLRAWQADAAYKRGDYARSRPALEEAKALGGAPEVTQRVEQGLDRATAPRVGLQASLFGDSNHVRFDQVGANGSVWAGDVLRMRLAYWIGNVSQRGYAFNRQALSLSYDNDFPWPQLRFRGKIGLELFDRTRGAFLANKDDALVVGDFAGTWFFEDASFLELGVRRESFWTPYERRDPRQWNRIIELRRLDPDFAINGVYGSFNKVFQTTRHEWLVSAGDDMYQNDDNNRFWAYSHYLVPLIDQGGKHWLALKPNFYVENFAHREPGYFSPQPQMTLGLMLHGLCKPGPWIFEAEINPQLQYADGHTGFGGHALFDATLDLFPWSVGVGLFGFWAGEPDYLSWRVTGHLGYAF